MRNIFQNRKTKGHYNLLIQDIPMNDGKFFEATLMYF